MSDMYDFIVKLRAIRQYSEGPVSRDDLEKILEAARWTGSSKNRQKWSFLVFTDREGLDGLARCGSFTQPLRDATAAIVLVQEPGGNMFDIGRAAQNIMLAAQAIGVASCPITLHKEDEVQDFLQPKSGQIARYAVALGYPTEDSKPANFGGRKEQQRLVRWL
ncbi:MAG: nitroreductase family protein [Acidimicrobiia bacterium]|nr:nitroreductase family protein [Acidimicrobiia bacterium]MDH3463541.1 nitroreductase family protein [Acidimicrobiia bacterium]